MKTPLLFLLLCLEILCSGLARGRDEAALADFEDRVKKVATPKEASDIATELLESKDYDRMEIALRYPRTANYVVRKYAAEPASEFKDRLTADLIARPWEPQESTAPGDPNRPRASAAETFKPYVDYMHERLGDDVNRMGSPEDLLKPDATADDRDQVIRRFKSALVKTGVVEGKTASRPRKNWTPGKDKTAAEGSDTGGGGATPWIIGAAVLVVGAAGFVWFRKKAA